MISRKGIPPAAHGNGRMMIQRINWSQPETDEPESPFELGDERRTIKITFHSDSFSSPEPSETAAIEMLRSLSKLHSIDAVDTLGNNLPKLVVGEFNLAEKFVEVSVERDSGCSQSGVDDPRQWLNLSREICGRDVFPDQSDPEVQSMLQDVLVARAHYQIGNDILVTLSPELLANRGNRWINEVNPLTPIEAIKLIGLFLRCKDNYTIKVFGNAGTQALDKGSFYWVAARNLLPAMWKYFSACVEVSKNTQPWIYSLTDTGGSILSRCTRALEARDYIGMQFYVAQNNQTRDNMMYHFDYLTLLLSGVFDAQALVAREVYSVTKPNERNTNFRNSEFMRNLGSSGGIGICDIIESDRFRALSLLLGKLRNSIHGSMMRSLGYKEPAIDEQTFVYLHTDHSQDVWDAAERYSSVEHWGLRQSCPNIFEPFTYSTTLVEQCFKYIDQIASATEVERLFSGQSIPELMQNAPKDGIFNREIMSCVELLS